jgi:hypothetical protein
MTLPISESYREIVLTQGQIAKVDATDYEWLAPYKWHSKWCERSQSFYAARTEGWGKNQRTIRMNRQILGLESSDKRKGDHWNHDTLDNRRANLRICSHQQNCCNKLAYKNNKSGYKGVSRKKGKIQNPWRAQIKVNQKTIQIGYYPTPELAHEAYEVASIKFHGEFGSAA